MCYQIRKTASTFALSFAIAFGLLGTANQSAQAQTFSVIYSFTGHNSAAHPIAGVTVDQRGNLYGTTAWGGLFGGGTVYRLQPTEGGYLYSELHDFGGGTDGSFLWDPVTLAANGSLYGTTGSGGANNGGTVFNLRPPVSFCRSVSCPWDETILYNFSGSNDGRNPQSGVIFDSSGNIYGANVNGGGGGAGVVYEMSPSDGGWSYQTLYTFTGGQDGANPSSPLMFDRAGNIYGTAAAGGQPGCAGFGCGTVYQLTPSGSGWTEHTLYTFHDSTDGAEPSAGLVADGDGNLYGATCCGDENGGTLFYLSPSGGSWSFYLVYDLVGTGPGPSANLVRDGAGNLYGASWGDGRYGRGVVFKLTPTNNGWIYTSLHDFTGGSDGGNAEGGLAIDGEGNIYGTTYQGGLQSCAYCGVVYKITPQ